MGGFIRRHALVLIAATLPAVASAQEARVTGRVMSEAAVPIAGVSVRIGTLGLGAITGSDGRYSFFVPAARIPAQPVTLTARLLGYTQQSATITLRVGTNTQDFTLTTAPTRLSQVVVTGEGTSTTREHLTTTINSVDTTQLQRAAQPQNVVSALAAKAPNVVVRTQSGEPGASASIKIRGNASLTGTNQPLFVVDGQPIDNSTISTNGGDQSTVTQNRVADINPNDIASIDILKGAAAAAIYGARAANGVVLITTKRGTPGTTRFSFNSTETFDRVAPKDILQRAYGQGQNGKDGTCAATDCTANRYAWGPAVSGSVFDHLDEIYTTGLTADNSLSVSGGSERTTFYASGGLTTQNGVIKGPNNKYNRATARLKGTHELTPRLTVGGNFNFIDTRGNYVQKGSNVSGLLLGALRTPPSYNNEDYLTAAGLQRPYRFPNPSSVDALQSAAYYDNPFFVLNSPGNRSELGRSIANVNVDWQALDWLRVQYTLGGDYYNDSRLEALPLTSAGDPTGDVTRYDINNLEIDHNLIASAKHAFRQDNINTTLTIGQNLNSRRYRDLYDFGETLIAPAPLSINNTVTVTSSEFKSLRHIEAYFAQLEANLYNQVDVNVGVREDGFSTFGTSKQYNTFPKASIAWIFTNTLGNSNQTGLLSFGKLRAAYGETGKEPPVYGAITALSSLSTFGSGFGDAITTKLGGQGGLVTGGTLGNDALKPERSREAEFGLDLGLFDQRADFSFTYYDKRTSDVILAALPINASQTGAFQTVQNGAKLTNEGIEISFNARPYTTDRLAWDVGFQYGRNRGNVKDLLGAEFIPYNNEGFTGAIGSSTLGYAPGVIRGKDFARCGISDIAAVTAGCGNAPKGALYLGLDGKPILDPVDRVIGDPNPKYTMSFSSGLHVGKHLTLSGLLDVRKGGDVWDGTRGILENFGTSIETLDRTNTNGQFGVNVLTDKYPVVAGPGVGVVAFKTPTDWQNWYLGNGGGFGPVGAQFIEDGSFAKLRELSLTYNLTGRVPQMLGGFSSVDLRIAGRNLHTWTKYKGLDPEANLGGAEFLTQGLDYFNSPQVRSFVISLGFNR